MGIQQYAKVLLLSPITGGAILCTLGVVAFGIALSREHVGSDKAAGATPTLHASPAAEANPIHTAPLPVVRVVDVDHHSADTPHTKPSTPNLFHSVLSQNDCMILRLLAEASSKDAVKTPQFRTVLERVVPYTPFHFGVDVPLSQALESVLARSAEPARLREGRYALFANTNGSAGVRGFLWVDLQKGEAVGGIFFHPANGEPTPTLTLFSSQVLNDSMNVRALPAALLTDLRTWSEAADVPTVSTRYFVNATGKKTVLVHRENFCAEPHASSTAEDACESLNAKAAGTDAAAAAFLAQTHNASNATIRMLGAAPRGE